MSGRVARHFLMLFLPLLALVVVAAVLIGRAQTNQELDRLSNLETSRVALGGTELGRSLIKVPQHLSSLQRERAVLQAIDDPTAANLAGMEEAFTTLLQRNPEYDQARWIDEHGVERVRANRSDNASGVTIVPQAELQDKSDRSYFKKSVILDPSQIYVSELDLNVENGKVSVPFEPTIRFATPVIDHAGARRGVLIINYLADSLIQGFINITGTSDRHVSLLNRKGYWLSSPDPKDEWGFMFGRDDITLSARFPAAWQRIAKEDIGQALADDGLWTWRTVSLSGQQVARQSTLVAPTWIVVSHNPKAVTAAILARIWTPVAGVAGVLALVFAALSWLIAVRADREQREMMARVKLEETQKARGILASIVDSTSDAIISKTLDGTITSWNAGAQKLYGYSAAEAVGRNIRMLIPADRLHEEDEIIGRVAAGEMVDHFETARLHKDGHPIDISVTISPIRDAAGQIIGASKIARDITEEKRNEAELERHREHLEQLVEQRTAEITQTTERLREREKLITAVTDNIPGMVGYWDRDLKCRFANRAYFDWFGKSPEEMIGKSMRSLIDQMASNTDVEEVDAVLRGEPRQSNRVIRKHNGEAGHLFVHYIPDFDEEKVIGFFTVAIDVSPLKKAEEDLRLSNEKLTDALAIAQEASQAKSQFLANMSHEIRTPMNGVIGMLELLGHTALSTEQTRMIGTINSSAQSLLQIINDILDFSKIEAGQLKIEEIATDPAEVVESTTRLFLGAASTKDLLLRCFVAPEVRGRYLTDPVRLRQIMSNLLSNAIKFTTRGSVTVTADIAEAGIAESGGSAPALRFTVADTGIGISPEAQARLFQPFTQADDSTARKFGGTGLGLSICLRLAELMGGKISLRSREGQGTEIELVVPARPSEAVAEVRTFDLHGVTVAILSPDEAERRYFSAYLAYWGAAVTAVSPDAADVCAQLQGPFSVIVAPAAMDPTIRTLVESTCKVLPSAPRRYVFYSHDDVTADLTSGTDAIVTTSLSRARMVTAVAIATGRKSPEVEMTQALPASGAQRPVPSRDQAIRDGRLILLAEDHPVNREVILRQLRFLGYAADAVEDGRAALAALARTRYSLLLTDCNMPVMDGFELVKNIRSMEADGVHLPIIALTANALEGEDRKCLAAGMDDYLSKPVEMALLNRRLEHWLSKRSVAVAPAAPDSATPADGEAESPINLDLLAEYCGDDPAALTETLRLYVESLKTDLDRLTAAVAESDAESVELYAHRMKGAARAVGGHGLAKRSEVVEQAAGSRDWITINRDMTQLSDAVMEMDRTYRKIASA